LLSRFSLGSPGSIIKRIDGLFRFREFEHLREHVLRIASYFIGAMVDLWVPFSDFEKSPVDYQQGWPKVSSNIRERPPY
jgi:hypothetical protein